MMNKVEPPVWIAAQESNTPSTSDTANNDGPQRLQTASSIATVHSFILTNYDVKYQNTKLLLQQIAKYMHRDIITRIIPSRNSIILQTHDANFATTIRNKFSYEIFGKSANLTCLEDKRNKQPPPPRRTPTLSVVVRGVEPTVTDNEPESELKNEGH